MNKYDNIKTLLFTKLNIRQSCEYILNYLKNYCIKSYNREKIDAFYANLADILKRLLLLPSEGNLNLKFAKADKSLMQSLLAKNSNFEDFEILLKLFLAPLTIESEINLFSSLFLHSYGCTKFSFPLSAASANKLVYNIIESNQVNFLFNKFPIFDTLTFAKQDMLIYLQKEEMILTIKEYYMFIILSFMKSIPTINKVGIKEYYPNFKKFLDNISDGKFHSTKTEFIINNFDKQKSLPFNFYNILFLDLIYFTSTSLSENLYSLHNLELLVFAVQFLWLGEFTLIPQNIFFSHLNTQASLAAIKSPDTESPTRLFDNKSLSNNLLLNSATTNAGCYSCRSYCSTNCQSWNFNPSSIGNITLPNLLVLNSLKNLIIILRSKSFLFEQITNNKGEKITVLKPNVLLFNLQKALYSFFKVGFSKFSKDVSTNTPSEISLSDFATVWYCYISPWESSMNLGFNSNNTTSNVTNDACAETDEPRKAFAPLRYNKFNRNFISPIQNIFDLSDVRWQKLQAKINVNIGAYTEYVEINIHFYTDLFQDYIKAFCESNTLSFEELNVLLSILEIYNVSADGLFIHKLINYYSLKEFSLGRANGFSQSGIIENFIRQNPYLKKSVFPFDDVENATKIKTLIGSITNMVFKLSNSPDYKQDEAIKIIKKLENAVVIFRKLYNVEKKETDFYNIIAGSLVQDQNNIYDRRIFLEASELDSPWIKKPTTNEFKTLYTVCYYASYFIDYLKKIPKRYNTKGIAYPPKTNLRYLCNIYNFISLIGMLVLIYFMLELIYFSS